MIVLVQFVTVTRGLEWRQIDGVHTPEKIPYMVFSGEPLSANAGGPNKRPPAWSGVAFHLAQFFHQYPSVTQRYTALLHTPRYLTT
jgi:hypothetical protein